MGDDAAEFLRQDPLRELERMIRTVLDEQGPMPFGCIYDMTCKRISIAPASLHDALNNLLAAGTLQIAPTGFYLLG